MSVYDKAKDLAEELKESEEFISYKKANEKIKEKEEDKKILRDFRKVQLEAYSQQVKDGKISEETEEKFKKLAESISNNSKIGEYLKVEQKFAILWKQIMKILNEAVDIDLNYE